MNHEDFINLIRDVLGSESEDFENIKNLLSASSDKKFRIVNAGPMNPGKSTLFNAILNKGEIFKTADARQTSVAQEESWKNDIVLIDTPGCNSTVLEDNVESLAAFRKADFITFVHNINTGGLNDAELRILSHIKTIFGETDFQSRVCIVCNRIDDIEDDQTLIRNRNEINSQVQDNLGMELKLYCVSPLNYLEGLKCAAAGKKEEAQLFIESSKMSEFLDAIDTAIATGKRGMSQLKSFVDKLEKMQQK